MTSFHVDPQAASDGDGLTAETPWILYRQVAPGDTVLFKRGSVYPAVGLRLSKKNGVTLGAYGEGNAPKFPLIRIMDCDDVSLLDLHAHGGLGEGIKIYNCDRIALQNVEASNHYGNGLEIAKSRNVLVNGSSFHNNGHTEGDNRVGHGIMIKESSTACEVVKAHCFNNAEDGIQFASNATGNFVRFCRLYGNREDGIDVKSGSQTFEFNWIYGNVVRAIGLHGLCGLTVLDGNVCICNRYTLTIDDVAFVDSRNNVYASQLKSAVAFLAKASKIAESKFAGDILSVATADQRHVQGAVLEDNVTKVTGFDWTTRIP